ncbi:MAG: hypothetical protein JNJ60_06245 [Rhodocyclaceae bacterium]|nr:hypothetical protein [Rhodocyclaceae bacterium]
MDKILLPRPAQNVSRRQFLLGGAALIGAASLPDALAAGKACRPTEQDIIGPFYRFGAPFETRLAGPDESGERIAIAGTVYAADCRSPLPNALIEIWQANAAGVYDTSKPGNFTERHDFHLRAMMLTDQRGHYEFETVMPGRYPVPPGLPGLEKYAGLTRPAHIHFRVTETLHVPLTTQLYFQGDPHIAKDPFAGHKHGLAIALRSDAGLLRGRFDIVLARG